MEANKVASLAFLNQGGEMGSLMRRKDWSNTVLGAPENWPQSLRTAVSLLLNSQFPMFVWWGEELITLYNDAYRVIAGDKHPSLLGKSGKEGWAEIWHDLSPLVASVFQGTATWSDDQVLYINRRGYVEETYFTFSYSPILDEYGLVSGLFCACIETTDKVLAARKLLQSEQNLRSTILQSPVAMSILKGPSFVVEIANTRMYELWGRSEADIVHRPIFEGLPEARQQGLEELLQHVYLTGETVNAQERPIQLPRNNGVETLYINFTYEPFRDENGGITGIIVVAADVSEQVSSRRKIEESEIRTRLAATSAQLGMYELNLEDNSFVHSPRLSEIFGLDPARQWTYEQFTGAILPEDLPVRTAAVEHSLKTGDLLFESRIKRPDASIRWIRMNGKYILEGGKPCSIVGTVMDITEEKKAAELLEQKIEERTRELKALNDQLKQFTYAASHDLQEPLRKINFFVDRLIRNIGPQASAENERFVERIQHTVSRMRQLIDDLLAYSNTAIGNTVYSEVDLNEIVTEVVEDMETTIAEKGAQIHLQPLPTVHGDHRQLRQLFQNLISNAVKYHKAGQAPQIYIRSQEVIEGDQQQNKGNNFYKIEVQDEGIGFDPVEKERIFQLFQRLHGKSEYEGTGIGLAIVQKVVENHRGRIWAKSEPGSGSTFTILLPK